MTDSTGAEDKSKDDASKSGAAHSTGESQGDQSPGDGFVKKSQFLAALNSATAKTDEAIAKADRLERELAEVKAAKAVKPPTREELLALVDSGDLTRSQADDLWKKQIIDEVSKKTAADVTQAQSEQERARRVATELQGYKELVPDVWVDGSEERVKVGKEFDHLVSLGYSKTPETEAAALRAAYGSLDVLRASKTARTGPADTHAETGGGHKPAGDATKGGPPKGITAEQRDYYTRQIDAGRYTGWDAVSEELKFARPTRAKAR